MMSSTRIDSPIPMRLRHRQALVLALLVPAGVALADFRPQNVTAGEMARLPAYCEDVQGFKYGGPVWRHDLQTMMNDSPRAPHWVGMMGPTFWALHHYCWALIYIQRYELPGQTVQQRAALMNWAINDIRYVLNHATPDFLLLPELYLRMGECYLNLKALTAAGEAFAESRKAKPDYWPPYVRWAEALSQMGRQKEAREHLEVALRLMPGERELHGPYRRLGGDPARFLADAGIGAAVPAGPAMRPTAPAGAASGVSGR